MIALNPPVPGLLGSDLLVISKHPYFCVDYDRRGVFSEPELRHSCALMSSPLSVYVCLALGVDLYRPQQHLPLAANLLFQPWRCSERLLSCFLRITAVSFHHGPTCVHLLERPS